MKKLFNIVQNHSKLYQTCKKLHPYVPVVCLLIFVIFLQKIMIFFLSLPFCISPYILQCFNNFELLGQWCHKDTAIHWSFLYSTPRPNLFDNMNSSSLNSCLLIPVRQMCCLRRNFQYLFVVPGTSSTLLCQQQQ